MELSRDAITNAKMDITIRLVIKWRSPELQVRQQKRKMISSTRPSTQGKGIRRPCCYSTDVVESDLCQWRVPKRRHHKITASLPSGQSRLTSASCAAHLSSFGAAEEKVGDVAPAARLCLLNFLRLIMVFPALYSQLSDF